METAAVIKPADMPAPGLVQNKAGGFVHQISDFSRFKRFLILGADSNTFYATAKELTLDNAKVVVDLLKANSGLDMVNEIVTISQVGRAPRQSPGIFALAIIMTFAKPDGDMDFAENDIQEQKTFKADQIAAMQKVRKAAMEAIPKVCRTASTLYELMAYYKALSLINKPDSSQAGMGKWGNSLRTAIARWYLNRAPIDVAMQVTKYKTRNDISSRDLLRLAHPKPSDLGKRKREDEVADMQLVLKYTTKPADEVVGDGHVADFLRDVQKLKKAEKAEEVVEIISRHKQMGWEHVGDSALLKHPAVWAALLDQGMGLTAIIRNLNRFLEIQLIGNPRKRSKASLFFGGSAFGMDEETEKSLASMDLTDVYGLHDEPLKKDKTPISWDPPKDYLQVVVDRITDKDALRIGKIHPLRVLLAQATLLKKYMKSSLPPALLPALDQSFELTFATAKPTGKKFLIAIDVSGSMDSPCVGSDVLTCREATAAITMILNRIEPNVQVVAFCDQLVPFPLRKDEPLHKVIKRTSELLMGGTDCSLPITHALENKLDVDVFVVLTDSETWCGNDVSQCLRQYRASRSTKNSADAAKLIVCAFSSTEFSIADPADAGMLDVAGFDSALPEILYDFVLRN